MKKYWNIYRIFINNAFSYAAHYRRNTWLKIAINIFWMIFLGITIEVIFTQTQTIAGWEKHEVYLMMILWIIVDEIYTLIFEGNMDMIPHMVTDGGLDMYLTKPAHSLFIISTKKVFIHSIWRLITQLLILVWLFTHFNFSIAQHWVIAVSILIPAAVMINYASALILNTLSFWLFRIDNVNDLWNVVRSLGRYPLSILPKTLKIITLTAIPIAFQAYVPASILTVRAPWYGVLYAFVFTMVIFFIAVKFWNFAVKRYSSASS